MPRLPRSKDKRKLIDAIMRIRTANYDKDDWRTLAAALDRGAVAPLHTYTIPELRVELEAWQDEFVD